MPQGIALVLNEDYAFQFSDFKGDKSSKVVTFEGNGWDKQESVPTRFEFSGSASRTGDEHWSGRVDVSYYPEQPGKPEWKDWGTLEIYVIDTRRKSVWVEGRWIHEPVSDARFEVLLRS